jgi:hypothetical protein
MGKAVPKISFMCAVDQAVGAKIRGLARLKQYLRNLTTKYLTTFINRGYK